MASHGEIESVAFGLQTDRVRLVQSRTQVQTPELFIGPSPVPKGLYDAHMGTTDMRYRCTTCGNNRRLCPGHPGHIVLPFPVVLPLGVAEVRRWLRVICLHCAGLMFDPQENERIARAAAAKRLATAAAVVDTVGMACPSCRKIHPKIVKTASDSFSFQMEISRAGGGAFAKVIQPFQLARLFQGVSDETVAALGRDPRQNHPRWLLVHTLQVPPVSIRPAVRMSGPGGYGSSFHDINNILQYISRASETLTTGTGPIALPAPGQEVPAALIASISSLQQLVYDLLQGSSVTATQGRSGRRGVVIANRAAVSIARRQPRKSGRLRKHLLGKRVWSIARNTISGLSKLKLDELGIPESFARSLQVVEVVQPENMAYLMRFFLNGRRQYPGASRVWRAATRTMHDVDGLRANRLEPGDVLYRDVVTGDYACFNRQPSLERSAIGVHRVVVMRDIYGDSLLPSPPRRKTFAFNVGSTTLYNADFDGDEMNLVILSHAGARAEAQFLAGVAQAFISTKSSGPVLGMVQDSTVGSFLLSRIEAMDKIHAMSLFERAGITPPDFSDMQPGDRITGREAISRLLEQTPISLTRTPSWFSQSAKPYIKFRPDETLAVIRRGKMVTGVLDKATVGGGASGGVFHRISRVFGPEVALRVIFALQQMTIVHMNLRGFTISVSDMILPAEKNRETDEIIAAMMLESELINERLMRGELVPPLKMSLSEYYGRLQLEALKVPDTILGPVLSSLDPDTNGMLQMVSTGSKGNLKNVINIMGLVGQITINTRRIGAGNTGRTLAYFQRGDMSPEASGFVRSNYLNGLTAAEHYFGAMNGRYDLTNKALSTAETGYANRKSIMSTQSAITDSMRAVCGPNLIQVIYGEDGMDARQVEPITYPIAFSSDAEIREQFQIAEGDLGHGHGQSGHAAALQQVGAWHNQEVDQLIRDRDNYRDIYLTIEQVNFSYSVSGKVLMAVDVGAIAQTVFPYSHQDPAPEDERASAEDLQAMHLYVTEFCDNIPYLLLNSAQQKKRAKIPLHMQAAVVHLQRLIRVELSSVRLLQYGATAELLQLAFDDIRLRYLRSLVPPGEAVGVLASQAVSEPLTQYMLDSHHRSVSGGTNKSGIIRPQEIMGARPVEREASSEMILRGMAPTPEGNKITNDRALLQELADSIKLLTLEQLTASWYILYEAFPTQKELEARSELERLSKGPPARPPSDDGFYEPFMGDWGWIEEFLRTNPLLKVPSSLTEWCARFTLDRMKLVMKSITLETVVTRLREAFPTAYILHTPEGVTKRTPNIVVRVYLSAAAFRRSAPTRTSGGKAVQPEKVAEGIFEDLLKRPLRGILGITDANVEKGMRHNVVESGPDKGKLVQEEGSYVIRTVGTNIHGALLHTRISKKFLISSSIGDTIKMYGIEAGRTKIINEIRRVMGGRSPNVRHLQIYADQMTRTGRHTPFESGGIGAREPSNILLRAAAHGPVAVLTQATLESVVNPNYGIAAPLVLGGVPKVGTNSVRLVVDGDFVAANRQSVARVIDEL